jgi:hypothetical protein
MTSTCDICCEKFTKKVGRVEVNCVYCLKSTCRECVQNYLLTQTSANCMLCKKDWSLEFLYSVMTKSFVNTTWRDKRQEILFEEEQAKLPETQIYAKRRLIKAEQREKIKNMKILQLQLKIQLDAEKNIQWNMDNGIFPGEDGIEAAEKGRKQFVKKCPEYDNCRGYLSTKWKCGMCDTKVCSKCFEIKKDEHECKEDDVASANAIRKDTKACPGCGVDIFHMGGCFSGDTVIPLWGGCSKIAKDIKLGDELIGDDGQKRTVHHLITGEDEMFKIHQEDGEDYIVNKKHTLVLISGHNRITELVVEDYIKLSQIEKNNLRGFKSKQGVFKKTNITVKPLGKGTYYGWTIDGNNRFVLPDFTCVKNCGQMFCVECNTVFWWRDLRIQRGGQVHNPHHTEWRNRTGGGENHERDACGGVPRMSETMRIHTRVIGYQGYRYEQNNNRISKIWNSIERLIYHNQNMELPPLEREDTRNLRIDFILKELNEQKFKQKIANIEKKNHRNHQYSQIFQMHIDVSKDLMYEMNQVEFDTKEKYEKDQHNVFKKFQELNTYFNEQMMKLTKLFGTSSAYVISDINTVFKENLKEKANAANVK